MQWAQLLWSVHLACPHGPSAACQIARISAATSVCPLGLYTAAEEDGSGVVLAEDFEPPAQAVLGTPAGWCHRCPPLRLPGALPAHAGTA